jgi:hypothetical protein
MQPLINPEEPKKPLSDAKLAANRANAQHSTGPKTEAGKQASAKNSLNHGLLAAGIIPEVDGPNAKEEFDRFRAEMLADYQPVGRREELQFGKMVLGEWHDRRALRFLEAKMAVRIMRKKRALAAEQIGDERNDEMELEAAVKPEARLTTADGVATVIRALQEVRETLARENALTEPAKQKLLRYCRAELVKSWFADQAAAPAPGTPSQEQPSMRLLVKLDMELKSLKERKANLEEEEARDRGLQLAAVGLPGRYLDRALRYGTTYRRAAQKAREELERLQAKRRGDLTSPEERGQTAA